MAMVPMAFDNIGRWTKTSLTPRTGSEAVNNYGIMNVYINKNLHLGIVVWMGNSTQPTAGEYSFDLPSDYLPSQNYTCPLKGGQYMEVRGDGRLALVLPALAWTGGTLIYVLYGGNY